MSNSADDSVLLECGCGSEVVRIDRWEWDNSEEWYVEFFTAIRAKRPWKDRFRIMWCVMRGREAWLEAAVLDRPDIEKLNEFCNRCLN